MEVVEKTDSDGRDLFHERRAQGIGGSDAPIICGLTGWKSPMQLWAEKSGVVAVSNDGLDPAWLELGNYIEPFIVAQYQAKTGRKVVRQGRYRVHSTISFMRCSLDGKVEEDRRQLDPGVWEAKFINPFQAGEWDEESEILPEKYKAQCQHNMAVTGYRWASIAALIFGKGLVIIDIERDEDYINALIEVETEFWECVKSKTPPVATGKDNKFLEKVYKQAGEITVKLDPSFVILDSELKKLKEIRKVTDSRVDELEATIKQALGPATYGFLPDGTKYAWKEQARQSYTVNAATFRTLRRTEASKPKTKKETKPTP